MKVSELQKAVKLISKISNQGSISELFRCVELGPGAIRAASEYGNIEVWPGLSEITTAKLVNTAAFAAVISTLPSDGELEIKLNDNQINWKCGNAKGHWSLIILPQSIPYIPADKDFSWVPPKDFPDAIELAGAACLSMTVSVGLFGVVLERLQDTLRMTSSNTVSLATSQVVLDGYPLTSNITLRPPVPNLLAFLLRSETNAKVAMTMDGIFLLSQNLVAHLPLSNPLDHNLADVIAKFPNATDIVKISSKAVNLFLSRAKALSDKNLPIEISLQISEGKILLEQRSAASSSEEYFLAEGIATEKTFKPVVLPLSLMVTSLQHVNEAVLDYLGGNVLILRGDKPTFMHVVGGKAK